MWNQFGTALSFLTVFRLPFTSLREMTSEDLAQSFSFFPLVGFLLGACCSGTGVLLCDGVPPLLLAVLITALSAILTRGLHLDGLGDLADGVGGGYTPQRRLEIMKDSRAGAFGVLAISLAVAFKIAAINTLVTSHSWFYMILVPILSRFSMVLGAYRIPYARSEGGLGKPFIEFITYRQPLAAAGLSLLFAIFLSRWYAFAFLGAALVCTQILRCLARHWLGGMTGDVLGALNEVAEIVLFFLAACLEA